MWNIRHVVLLKEETGRSSSYGSLRYLLNQESAEMHVQLDKTTIKVLFHSGDLSDGK